jgi:arabinogalactan endo-1,4-beta-galactosidase
LVAWLTAAAAALMLSAAPMAAAATDPFYMGADVSLATFMQQQGVVFRDAGVVKPLERILYDRGANLFRLRLFVNPQTTYTNTNVGAIQDLNYTLALAQQIKSNAPNAKILLDLHYSDTWADPGRQTTPAAWNGQTLAQVESTVRSYTQSTLASFRNAGVMPDMVQVGNEIQSGMLWEPGRLYFGPSGIQQQASWQNFGRLVNAAILGVRDAQGAGPAVKVAVHPGGSDVAEFFFSRLSNPLYGNVNPGSYDVMGVSYYPTTTNQLTALEDDLTSLIGTYDKRVMVLETNAPWTTTFAPASDPSYPDTPAGQLQYLTDLRDMVRNLPNDNGMGVLWWYPESVQVPGYNIYHGGSTALFDANRIALPALGAFAVPEPSSLCILALGLSAIAARPARR